MANTKDIFEAYAEGQRKMMDWWTDASKKMMEAVTPGTSELPFGPEFLKNWYEKQQNLLAEVTNVKDPREAMEKAPVQFKKWMDLQIDFQKKWVDAYREGMTKLGYTLPDMNGYAPEKVWEHNVKFWTDKMGESGKWFQEAMMGKLPFPMQPHYQNFTSMYDDLARYWGDFQKMIRFGIFDPKMVENFFPMDKYREWVDKTMGFTMPANAKEGLEQFNEFFENYQKFVEQFTPSMENWDVQWSEYFKSYAGNKANPFFQATLDMNQRMKESIEPFIHMIGYGKPGRYAQILKDIQFAYTAFVLRSTEMQNRTYRAVQFALPDTIKVFYDDYLESKEMPEFETFFNGLVNNMEKYLTKLLESKEYSLLQAEVSKLGVTVKGKLDELMELSFDQTPFLMKSHGDDLAKEIHSLRRKVRELEKKLKEVKPPVTKKPVARKPKATATTAK